MTAEEKSWPWERLNQGNASSHEVLATLLDPQPGERWLDVGTGGGGLAFSLARRGADVVGVDVAEDGLVHAREETAARGLAAEFVLADAQALPFEDAVFDGVASAFGVIFASDQQSAASELARVCRPGGKLGLTLMPMDSRTGETFTALARRGGPDPHPATWAEKVEQLLGDTFDVEVERRDSLAPRHPSHTWEESVRTFRPLRDVVERVDEDEVATLRGELEMIEERYRDRAASYFVVVGRRR
ncbi:MAG: class I SAM-dependent methyltransferase [Actinobacteria bacterium]|nr:class I SAM-dependent methyltransferase [Actinomycetota bacterium]